MLNYVDYSLPITFVVIRDIDFASVEIKLICKNYISLAVKNALELKLPPESQKLQRKVTLKGMVMHQSWTRVLFSSNFTTVLCMNFA